MAKDNKRKKPKTAVLYARFSCSKQREVSIDDQLDACAEYCKREGIEVVRVYSDRAISGRTDRRDAFQLMIANAPESTYIVVYMMERFSRGKYDPSIYKKQLEDKGVRVLSALEYIPDAPEGILVEKILEGQAAYFSLDVARKTRRGMVSNAEKSMYNGYKIFGYSVDPDTKQYIIDEQEAAIVKEIYRRYIDGETINKIAWTLALRGVKTSTGNPAEYGWAHRILHNDRYTGIYRWDDVEVLGGMPQIIDEATYRSARGVVRKKVRANEDNADYPLTGKLYCAICGHAMHGSSGTSGTSGKKYHYYSCKKGSSCNRKSIRKEKMETAVSNAVLDCIDNEEELRRIAERIEQWRGESSDKTAAVKAATNSLKENKKAQSNILKAVEQGIIPSGTRERLAELELEEERLALEVARLRAEDCGADVDELVEFLKDVLQIEDPTLIMKAFVNRVYVFDGYAVVTLNYRRGDNELSEVRIALEEFVLCTDGARGESRTRTSFDNGF